MGQLPLLAERVDRCRAHPQQLGHLPHREQRTVRPAVFTIRRHPVQQGSSKILAQACMDLHILAFLQAGINLNVHFHTLVPDGVFDLEGAGQPRFVPIPPPRDEELAAILDRIVRRTAKALVGYDDLASEDDALAALQATEVDRRLRFPDPFRNQRHTASLDGFSLHAGVRIHEHDREGLERLCRYAVRPPFALQRLSQGENGQLVYRMKRPRGGSLFLLLEPDELLARLATLVPPPRIHSVRYHGVFAPNSRVRARVDPAPAVAPEPTRSLAGEARPCPGNRRARLSLRPGNVHLR